MTREELKEQIDELMQQYAKCRTKPDIQRDNCTLLCICFLWCFFVARFCFVLC